MQLKVQKIINKNIVESENNLYNRKDKIMDKKKEYPQIIKLQVFFLRNDIYLQMYRNQEIDENPYITDMQNYETKTKNFIDKTRPSKLKTQQFLKNSYLKLNTFKPEQYYNQKLVKPGIHFYKLLLQSYENNFPIIQKIKANIPQTICMQSNRYNIIYSQNNIIKRKSETSYQEFERLLGFSVQNGNIVLLDKNGISQTQNPEKIDSVLKDHNYKQRQNLAFLTQSIECPFLISRTSNGISFQKHIINKSELKLRRLPNGQSQLFQKFIVPYEFKANLVRLHIYTKQNRQLKTSYAYKIVNKSSMIDLTKEKKYLLVHNMTINFEKQDSFQYQIIRGKCLDPFISTCESVIKYLSQLKSLIITQGVFDFIVDLNKKPWLINLKMLKSVEKISKPLTSQTNQFSVASSCKVCGINFRKDQNIKIITTKLIYQLLQNLKRRGIQFLNIKISQSDPLNCKVCQLCYSVVVAQHNLINVTQQLSKAQNIIQQQQIQRIPKPNCAKLQRPLGIKSQLYQWRMLVYLDNITNFSEDYLENDCFQIQNLTLQYKLFNMKTKFKIKFFETVNSSNSTYLNRNLYRQCKKTKQDETSYSKKDQSTVVSKSVLNYTNPARLSNLNSQNLNLKNIRVHYFFSKSDDISQFLEQAQLKFKIGYPQSIQIAEGRTRSVNHFKNRYKLSQRHSNQVFLFFKNKKYCNLQLDLGLVCDGLYSAQNLNLYQYSSVYFPDQKFYNCNPFPENWMQIFKNTSHINTNNIQGSNAGKNINTHFKFQQNKKKNNWINDIINLE